MASLGETVGRPHPRRKASPRHGRSLDSDSDHLIKPGNGNFMGDITVLNPVGALFTVLGVYIAFFSSSLLSTLAYGLILGLLAFSVVRLYGDSLDGNGIFHSLDVGGQSRPGRPQGRRRTGAVGSHRGGTRQAPLALVRQVRETLAGRHSRLRSMGGERL
jgi:hypothetical protein